MKYLHTAAFFMAFTSQTAFGQTPKLGDVQTLNVVSVCLQVGSTEKATKKITYTPPPGWYVRSHEVHCSVKQGQSSYTINTIPADWTWSSEEEIEESYRRQVDAAIKAQDLGLRAKLLGEQKEVLNQFRQASCSHHALVVDAVAKGRGLFQGGGALEITVSADLVYVGLPATTVSKVPTTAR